MDSDRHMSILDRIDAKLDEASAAQAVDRANELHDLLMGTDAIDKLKDAGMKTQKEASKIFNQAIQLLKGLGKDKRQFKKIPRRQ